MQDPQTRHSDIRNDEELAAYNAGYDLGKRHGETDPRSKGQEADFSDESFYAPLEDERDKKALEYGPEMTRLNGGFRIGYEDGYSDAIGGIE